MMCFKPMLIIKNAGQAKQREQFIELIQFLSERRIMKAENEIESLIVSTMTHIKTALENNKPGEAQVYTQILVLLRQTLILPLNRNVSVDMNKPFEKISEKHIPDV